MIGILLNRTVAKGQRLITKNFITSLIDVLEDVAIIDVYSGNKTKHLIKDERAHYIHIPWDEKNDNWKSYYDKVVTKCNDLDSLVIFSSPIYTHLRNVDCGLLSCCMSGFNKGRYDKGSSFNITRNVYAKSLIIKSFVDNHKKVVDFLIDPQEPDYCKFFGSGETGYILNKDNLTYIPSYEYQLFKNSTNEDKTVDFTFYCTALTEDRQYIIDCEDRLKIPNSDVEIIKCLKKGSSYVSQEEYYKKLAKSKFTLVIPSYDVSTFSIIRFFEAIVNKCVPLILDTCDLTDLKNTFPDIYEIAVKSLVVNINSIKLENLGNYDDIISQLLNTETIKNFSNINYFKNEWSKYL